MPLLTHEQLACRRIMPALLLAASMAAFPKVNPRASEKLGEYAVAQLAENPSVAVSVMTKAKAAVQAMIAEVGKVSPKLMASSAAAAVMLFAVQQEDCPYPQKLAADILCGSMLESSDPIMVEVCKNALAMVLCCNQLHAQAVSPLTQH
jgi:hypothetical protein